MVNKKEHTKTPSEKMGKVLLKRQFNEQSPCLDNLTKMLHAKPAFCSNSSFESSLLLGLFKAPF